MKKILLPAGMALMLFACQKTEFSERHDLNDLPSNYDLTSVLKLADTPTDYNLTLPGYLTAAGLAPAPVSAQKATLGRVLFYDSELSKDRTISCASCHKQTKAFSDTEPFSVGINGFRSTRNSMPLANVASFSAHYDPENIGGPQLLWDNRAATVAQQSTMAFLNEHEMGMKMEDVVARVKEKDYYDVLWQRAYGNFEVDATLILECLTEFVGAMSSSHSRFDQALDLVNGNINFEQTITVVQNLYYQDDTLVQTLGLPGFNASENNGRKLFVENCSKCHSPIRPFQEVREACNGLDLEYQDKGKGGLTGLASDEGVFKSPSLRNIALTAPYMHDGRFKTLREVVDFYSTGVKNHPNLHPEMVKNGSIERNFTTQQKNDLIAFLNTLTDRTITTDERFSDPFWH